MLFTKARGFVYRNARPLDLSLWRYFFEGGSKEDVLEMLAFYQNPDGGFGNALEADMWNPNSIPVGVWKATEVLANIGFTDAAHPLVKGMLSYLDSESGFDRDTRQWTYTMPTNNDYPHAIWWEHTGAPKEFNPNPNAALAGFILAYADKNSTLYQKGCDLAVRSYNYMIENFPVTEKHIVSCYIRLYEYCMQAGETRLFDLDTFREKIRQMVDGSLCKDLEKWGKEYVATPSTFINSPQSFLYKGNEALIDKECQRIREQQLEDGAFTVPWIWCTEYKEYEIAKNWWKTQLIIEKLLYLKNFGQLEN